MYPRAWWNRASLMVEDVPRHLLISDSGPADDAYGVPSPGAVAPGRRPGNRGISIVNPAPSPIPLDPEGALWRFAVGFNGEPGVAEVCLTLQARLGLDVNLMLLALFACLERKVALDPDALAAADGITEPWHREIVRGLRRVRTRLKEGPAPAPSPPTEALRQAVQAAELRAEQLQLAALAAWLDEQALVPATSPDPEPIVADVARHFAGETWNRAADPESAAALAALVRAAQRRLGDPPA